MDVLQVKSHHPSHAEMPDSVSDATLRGSGGVHDRFPSISPHFLGSGCATNRNWSVRAAPPMTKGAARLTPSHPPHAYPRHPEAHTRKQVLLKDIYQPALRDRPSIGISSRHVLVHLLRPACSHSETLPFQQKNARSKNPFRRRRPLHCFLLTPLDHTHQS